MSMSSRLRAGVVGAGPAGLCAARHAVEAGMECVVFEQSGAVGGTWQYTDCVGTDPYGIPVHTSMYRDLRTNLPKEVMMFPGIPHKNTEESYLTSEEILEYLNNYAHMFQLHKICKFNHCVKKISRTGSKWKVTVVDLPNSQEHIYILDVLFICNGLNNKPYVADFAGAADFKGQTLHSHDYRMPEPFTGQNVLIIGGGPSALDLANHISKYATKIFFSHHSHRYNGEDLKLSENVVFETDVKKFNTHSVQFIDGTEEDIDFIVYCTGYKCNYTFMDESCGVTEDEGLVYPLYKHFINANHRTMCILGNMCHSMQFPTFDIQVQFFIKSLADDNILPNKEDMLEDIHKQIEKKLMNGNPKKTYFMSTAEEDRDYYEDLAKRGDLEPLPKVLTKIHARAGSQIFQNFSIFRRDKYKIIDDENFMVSAD